jgi:molybdenum-dependent DNA-binding transcriptional regulator ModE
MIALLLRAVEGVCRPRRTAETTMTVPGFSETGAFIAVLEQRSFRKAAKLLNLSPSRVSEMVRRLEEQLGVRLLERTTRSVAPTTAGETLLMRLKPALEEYRAALDVANEFREKPAGTSDFRGAARNRWRLDGDSCRFSCGLPRNQSGAVLRQRAHGHRRKPLRCRHSSRRPT